MTGIEMVAMAGAALAAAGTVTSAIASSNAAKFNAQQAEIEAQQERQISEADAAQARREGSRTLAMARARQAGSGVSSQGTPLLMNEATAQDIELQAQYILAGGQNRARSLEADAALNRSRAKSSISSGVLGAGSTLLTGAYNTFG